MNQKKARAKTCNFIRVFRLSAKQKLRSEKEDKFKSLNIATCGKSFKLTDSQRRGLSSNGLKVKVIHQLFLTVFRLNARLDEKNSNH